MPSIFNDSKVGSHIVSLRCPAFNESTVKAAIKAQFDALAARHEFQRQQKKTQLQPQARTAVSRRLCDAVWNNGWQRTLATKLLEPDPSNFPEKVRGVLHRLRNALPSELKALVDEAPLVLDAKLALALAFEAKLTAYEEQVTIEIENSLAYKQLIQRQKGESIDLEERLEAGFVRWKLAQKQSSPSSKMGSSISLLSVTPSLTFNTFSSQPRYFRILVWNLENFTRDRRPRGASPIDSMRNSARIAIIADVLARFDVDLLLMMETGTDVGTATTRIADQVAKKREDDDRPWQPLVSPPTGALPEIGLSYALNLGRPSGLKALALRTLFEVYRVKPRFSKVPEKVTGKQIADAWTVLCNASPEASSFLRNIEVTAENAIVEGVLSVELFVTLIIRLEKTACQVGQFVGGELESDISTVHDILHSVANELGSGYLQTELPDLAYAILAARDAILGLDAVEVANSDSQAIVDEGIACLQGLELLTLFLIKAAAGKIPDNPKYIQGLVYQSSSSENCLVPLAAFLCTGAQHVSMRAFDQKLGPANGALDNDVLIDALARVGAVKRNIETYGIVYREPVEGALGELLDRGVLEHGFTGGLDEEAARYGIIKAQLSREDFTIQEAGGLLNWRSALQIMVPASRTVILPLVVYHTRYSGTAEINKLLSDHTNDENTINARCMSVQMIARAVLPGDSRFGPPLITGDFNVPDPYLNPEPKPSQKRSIPPYKRRKAIRQRFFGEMAGSGYLRHSIGGKPDQGYPQTTLKAYSSIARGESPLSQPYDGAYQPFDFAGGAVEVASGIVLVSGLLVDSVLSEKVAGVPSEASSGDVIDPDAGEDEELGDDEGSEDDEMNSESSPTLKTWTVGEAIAVELGRVYRGMLRRLKTKLDNLEEWSSHLGRSRSAKKWLKTLAPKLEELDQIRGAFDECVGERVTWFVKCCAAGETGTWSSHKGSDFLSTWRGVFDDLRKLTAKNRSWNDSFVKLVELTDDVAAQVTKLETTLETRRLVAYRAVVSDHLPQIIEIDLQP
ncbi:MAG: hypothetical protein R6X02_02445 [Enhygromyxa sp.]